MNVTAIIPEGRNAKGLLLSGYAIFDDGKEWKWIRVHDDGSYCFIIDSDVPSQWDLGNYGRTIAPPKRISALIAKLAELGELNQ